MILKLFDAAVTVALVIGLIFAFERPAYALPYVDPGSGLLVCQSVSAVVAGVMFYFRKRFKSALQKSTKHHVSPKQG